MRLTINLLSAAMGTGQAIENLGAQTMPLLVFASLAINALVIVMMLRQRNLMGNGFRGWLPAK